MHVFFSQEIGDVPRLTENGIAGHFDGLGASGAQDIKGGDA